MKDPNEVFTQEATTATTATIEEPIYVGDDSGGCQAGPALLIVFVAVVIIAAIVAVASS